MVKSDLWLEHDISGDVLPDSALASWPRTHVMVISGYASNYICMFCSYEEDTLNISVDPFAPGEATLTQKLSADVVVPMLTACFVKRPSEQTRHVLAHLLKQQVSAKSQTQGQTQILFYSHIWHTLGIRAMMLFCHSLSSTPAWHLCV